MYRYLLLLLVTLPIVSYGSTLRVKSTLTNIDEIHKNIGGYYSIHKEYPKSLNKFKGRYIMDSWGQDLIYKRKNESYLLYSIGPDGIDEQGNGDDVVDFETLDRSFYPELGPTHVQVWLILLLILLTILGAIVFIVAKLKSSNKSSK